MSSTNDDAIMSPVSSLSSLPPSEPSSRSSTPVPDLLLPEDPVVTRILPTLSPERIAQLRQKIDDSYFNKVTENSIVQYINDRCDAEQKAKLCRVFIANHPPSDPIPPAIPHPESYHNEKKTSLWYVARRAAAKGAENIVTWANMRLASALTDVPSITDQLLFFHA